MCERLVYQRRRLPSPTDIFEQFGQVPAFPLLSPLVQSTQLKALDGILKQPDARQILSSFTFVKESGTLVKFTLG